MKQAFYYSSIYVCFDALYVVFVRILACRRPLRRPSHWRFLALFRWTLFFFFFFFSLDINYNKVITENSACHKQNCSDLLARNWTETNLNFQGVRIQTQISLSLSKNVSPVMSNYMKDITYWSEFIYFISFNDSIRVLVFDIMKISKTGPHLNMKTIFPGMVISIKKIRWSWDLIDKMVMKPSYL